jgi:hypothetical protein
MLRRQFTTTARRLFEDSSKKSAIALDATITLSKNKQLAGNSFGSFKEYRKSATQHGPLKNNIQLAHHSPTRAIWTNEKDYGVSEKFKNIA